MTVEGCCHGGRKLTYHITMNDTKLVLTVESPFDGTEVPVLLDGKPSGETMAIKFVDDYHTTTVLKMNGQPFGTSKATLSADGEKVTMMLGVMDFWLTPRQLRAPQFAKRLIDWEPLTIPSP